MHKAPLRNWIFFASNLFPAKNDRSATKTGGGGSSYIIKETRRRENGRKKGAGREERKKRRGEDDRCTRAISMTMRAFENAPLSSFIVRAVSSWPRLMRLSSILGTVNGTPARLLENEKGSRSVEPREKLVDFQFVKEFSYYCYIICCYMIFIFYIKNYLVIILRR